MVKMINTLENNVAVLVKITINLPKYVNTCGCKFATYRQNVKYVLLCSKLKKYCKKFWLCYFFVTHLVHYIAVQLAKWVRLWHLVNVDIVTMIC